MTPERLRGLRLILLQGAVVAIPLTFSTRFLDAFAVPKLGLLVVVVGLGSGLLAAERLLFSDPNPGSAIRHLAVPATALTLPLVVAWTASPYRSWSVLGEYPRFQGILPYVVVAVFGLLLVEAFRNDAVRLAWSMGIAGAAVGGYLFLQLLGLDPVTWPLTSEPYTASTIGNSNFAGGFLAIAFPFPIYLWVHVDRAKITGAALTILTTLGLIFTFSQGAWAAALAASVLIVGSSAAAKWAASRLIALLAAGAIALILPIIVILAMTGANLGRLGPTAQVRGELWSAATQMAIESPLVGRGPNTFALEGLRYVSIEKAIVEPFETPDDPHSVFFSFLANAGVLGALGYLIALAWFVREGIKIEARDHIGTAFLASGSAYWVQSLVSIDELVLRVGLWVSLAGLVACSVRRRTGPSVTKKRARPWFRAIAAVAGVAVLAGSVAWTWAFVMADLHARRGETLIASRHLAEAREELNLALRLRDEVEYRRVLALGLGRAAITRGIDGADLIAEMDHVNSYLDEIPHAMGIFTAAQTLHHWGHFKPGADIRAFELYERGLTLDPSNLLALIESSEVLIDLGRADEAVARLQVLASRLEGRVAPFWGTFAIALTIAGDHQAASEALKRGGSSVESDCRGLIAKELIDQGTDPTPPSEDSVLTLRFLCDPGLYGFLVDHLPRGIQDHY